MKAKEWLERGKIENDPPNKLGDLWRGFNHLFFPEKGGPETQKLKGFLSNNVSEASATEILAAHPGAVDYLVGEPVVDMRGNGRDTQPRIDEFHNADDHLSKLVALFLIIYQVRCNLEHGQKSPNRARDMQLCANASCVLQDVLERCT